MTRVQLEHLIRAAASIADDDELIVIGSQSILGQFPDAPSELRVSMEADIFPRHHPERWDLIDGSLGEGSPFHETFGYYAQGVDATTARLPAGWRERLVAIRNANTRWATGWTLEIHDLLISKYVAGRPKDQEFTKTTAQHQLVRQDVLEQRLAETELEPSVRELVEQRIRIDFAP